MGEIAILEAIGVTKRYGAVTAVNDLSLAVPQGICLGLLGPNGAGKTTLVEIVEGIIPPSAGQVLYLGQSRGPSFREKIGIMFQQTALFGFMSVQETLRTFQSLYPHTLAVEELIRLGALRNTWGAVATANLMRIADPPTALFVASIALIPGVLATLQSYGIVVPDDVSLLCFDDVEWFSFTVPKITAISSSQSRLAEAAVTLLLTRIEEPEQRGRAPSLMEIKSELMLRGSTAGPRQGELVLRGWNGSAATPL